MPKRKCTFNLDLQSEFPLFKKGKTVHKTYCTLCCCTFSVSHGGRSDINDHIKSAKHKSSEQRRSSKESVQNWLIKKAPMADDLEIAAREGLFAYHSLAHDHSFRSMDCTSKLINKLWDSKFFCARTKSEAIVVNVYSPYARKELCEDLSKVSFVTLSTDTSNRRETKLLPVIVRYFSQTNGVCVKLLDFHEVPGETSQIIKEKLLVTMTEFELKNKLVGFSADNTNANFGGAARHGDRNVFKLMRNELQRPCLLGLGCNAHILHNAMRSATDLLPVDVEQITEKMFGYFHIYTVRCSNLKEFCAEVDIHYSRILGYSKTRWLALLPAVERILKMYLPLKLYFESQQKCPTVIKRFFDDPVNEAWLLFVHSQSSMFSTANTAIQSETLTAMEANNIITDLLDNLKSRKSERFTGMETKNVLRRLEREEKVDLAQFFQHVDDFFETAIGYITLWHHYSDIISFKWVLLKDIPTWSNVEDSLENINITMKDVCKVNGDRLFDQYTKMKAFITPDVMDKWNGDSVKPDGRWLELFQHFRHNAVEFEELYTVVQFAMCLPGSNAPIERIFSLMNRMWSSDKTQIKVDTIKAMLNVKVNFNMPCQQFFDFLKSQRQMLLDIHSSKKYGDS